MPYLADCAIFIISERLYEYGNARRAVAFIGNFIIGLSGETPKTARDTIDFSKELKLDNFGFNHANILPGTRLWDYVQEHGTMLYAYDEMDFRKFKHLEGYPIFETPEFTKKERIKAHEMAMELSTKIVRKRVITPKNIKKFIFRKNSYKDAIWALKRLYELYFKAKTDSYRHKKRKPSEQQ